MRADARRNRDRIVDAAIAEFSEHGEAASMQSIAASAGVSVGALYRHFPDRRDLIEFIASDSLRKAIAALDDARSAAAVRGPDTDDGVFAQVVRVYAELPLGLTHTLADETPRDRRLRELIVESNRKLIDLIEWSQARGSVRRDLAAEQVLAVISTAVCRPGVGADDPVVAVVLDGLCAG